MPRTDWNKRLQLVSLALGIALSGGALVGYLWGLAMRPIRVELREQAIAGALRDSVTIARLNEVRFDMSVALVMLTTRPGSAERAEALDMAKARRLAGEREE